MKPKRPCPPPENSSPQERRPPRWAERLLEWFVAPHLLEYVQGDLYEAFQKRLVQGGLSQARREYAWAVMNCLTPFFYKRKPDQFAIPSLLNLSMLRNYLTISRRNLWGNKVLSAIKILGLSLGLTVCVLIFLYSKDELSFDRFHANGNNIYRVIQDMRITNQEPAKLSTTQPPLGEAFARQIPEIHSTTRLVSMPVTIKSRNEVFLENPLPVDDNFFSTFSFDLLEGNPKTALQDVYSIVLTESAAQKYFGTDDAMGKTIQLKSRDTFENFTVTGIAADPPLNSTVSFTMLVPFRFYQKGLSHNGWIGGTVNTFLVLRPSANRTAVTRKMQQTFNTNTREKIAQVQKEQKVNVDIRLGLQPMQDIHFNKELGAHNGLTEVSSPVYSYVLSSIALFILLMACINFINLSIGQSLKRGREIGIRKVVGGNRGQLIVQFLTESFLVSLFAFILALGLATVILPFFNDLSGKKLSLSYLADGWLFIGLATLLLVTSLIAGFYPALVLSGFQPLKVLYTRYKLMGKSYFARGLIVFQFTLAIFLLIGTVAIYTQLSYLSGHKLGYDSSNLVRIDLPFSDHNDLLVERFRQELGHKKGIIHLAARNRGRWGSGAWADSKQVNIDLNAIDNDFFPTFRIPLKDGRNFSAAFPSDSTQAAIVNETFLKEAGWSNTTAIGKTIRLMEGNKMLTIVGVIHDFHYQSLKYKIGAQVFTPGPAKEYGQLWVKIRPDDIPATLNQIADVFRKLSPFYPYSYTFMDSSNAQEYESELKLKQLISVSALLFVFIACIGLLGVVMLSVEQRTKEIGIRKVLGAAAGRIFLLISREFIVLVILAFLLAIPAGYYVISRWLQEFPYRTPMYWWMFVVAGLTAIGMSIFTVATQSFRAALANPVEALRSE